LYILSLICISIWWYHSTLSMKLIANPNSFENHVLFVKNFITYYSLIFSFRWFLYSMILEWIKLLKCKISQNLIFLIGFFNIWFISLPKIQLNKHPSKTMSSYKVLTWITISTSKNLTIISHAQRIKDRFEINMLLLRVSYLNAFKQNLTYFFSMNLFKFYWPKMLPSLVLWWIWSNNIWFLK
jgi:hypothetical protein